MQSKPVSDSDFIEGFYASSDDLALYYRRYDHKYDQTASGNHHSSTSKPPTILCLPGVSRNHRDFLPLIYSNAICANWILLDLRGRCYSQYDSNTQNYNPAVYVADILSLLDFLQLEKVDIIGTSLGGILAMLLNTLHPERVDRVVLNDIGAFVAKNAIGTISNYLRNANEHTSWDSVINAIQPIYSEFFTDLTHQDWLSLAQRLFRQTGIGKLVPDYDPALFTNTEAQELDLWPYFNSLKNKAALVLRGANSALLPETMLEQMSVAHPGLITATIPNRGHAPFLDEPASITALKSFFSMQL